MSKLLNAYSNYLARKPLQGNVVTAIGLFGIGDGLAQMIEGKPGYDFARTARLCTWGGAVFAPLVGGLWFPILNRVNLGNKATTAITRASMDQFIAAPIVLGGFFAFAGMLEGKSVDDVKKKVESSWLPTLKTNWMVWVPFQAINMIVPPQYRFPASLAMNIPWNIYLSLQNAKTSSSAPAAVEPPSKPVKVAFGD
ncbi:hypothetical protein FFLO_00143 [Filobasidium floriforme]|uniref:Protein SYM1 n=1 Tax=Filobasidium floriforme TaxID=5210 RepID=A0A8K0JSS0_9TREE|nr:uncharacterized protein HD553DRAFT_307866 [Filobasidium floriforme]KAG7579935.1 hypothetical protein FFLO_00143 [Filobasidium floriforme]KAH8087330.1 hypothetical protein HD553DRAFT_307866 [Filobasidium floriforme]